MGNSAIREFSHGADRRTRIKGREAKGEKSEVAVAKNFALT